MSDGRPTAILTKAQREYLQGDREPTQEHTMKTRIRQRLRKGLLVDGPLIREAIDADALSAEQIVENADANTLAISLRSLVALVYQLAQAAGLDAETVIQDGIKEGRTSHAEALYERFQTRPETITLSELRILQESGLISQEEHDEMLHAELREPKPGYASPETVADLFGGDDADSDA